jgi:hypothetical protein
MGSTGGNDLRWLTMIIAIAAVVTVVLTYLLLASGTHILPYGHPHHGANLPSGDGRVNESPVASLSGNYQATWNGSISLGFTTVELSLQLGPGTAGQVVGTISSTTLQCDADVVLASNSSPVQLQFETATGQGACQLASVIKDATVTLLGYNYLKFTFQAFGLSSSCRMFRAA